MAHVLLVDDDADFIDVHRMMLEQGGHRVTAAYSAQEAWEAMDKARPDVLVLDVMMEEFDSGFRLAHDVAIRFPSLPILLLTSVHDHMSDSWQFDRDKDKGWLPVHRFLEKPVSREQLLDAIRETLAEAASRG